MKTLRNLFVILFASLLLHACGGSSPEAVVEKYFKAAKSADFKAVQKCLTKSVALQFDELTNNLSEEEINEIKKKGADLSVKNIRSTIEGETAVVYFDETHGDHFHERQIPMVKEDGEWKMSILY